MNNAPDHSRRDSLLFHQITWQNRACRALWNLTALLLYRPSPVPAHGWRRFLLRCFGAQIGAGAHPYPSAKIWAPWNLRMGRHSCLSRQVDCYNVAAITLGDHVTVSQYSYLCTASHDHRLASMPLVVAPISIADHAWVTSDVFVGPGVSIGQGALVGVRSTVMRDVPAWKIVAGTPARVIGERELDLTR